MQLAPQIIVIALVLLSIGAEAARHGEMAEPKRRNVFTMFVSLGISHGLLWWGGFYDPIIAAIGGTR